jgi:hypothetical protein
VTQAKKVGNALRVDQILGSNSRRHAGEPTGVD